MEKYEKLKSIGRGAYGTVYLCRRISDGCLFIIKQIPVEEMSKEERQAAMNEVKVLAMLKHPNIIAYFDSFFEEKALMIVMEYAQGGTVYNFLEERKGKLLDEEEIIRLFVQIMVAIHHVHQQNILHRDLKTQNILLNKTRKVVKIGDFGISKILSSKSKANSVIGTPCYISPELCEGKPYNQKSDIWALGCVLYELATLKRAFEASNLPALVLKIMKGNYDPISERYSEDFKKLVLSMLQIDPAKRPTLPQIMAQPILINALFNMRTDVGRVPCNRTPRPMAKIAAAIPPSRGRSSSGSRQTGTPMYRTSSSNSAPGILDGLPDLAPFSTKPPEPEYVVCHWGGGIGTPSKLLLPQHDSDVVQVASGRTLKTGVTGGGRLILWDSNKKADLSSDKDKIPDDLWLPRFLEGQSGVTIVQVSCGDLFVACLTDRGILMTFGSGVHGSLGHGDYNDVIRARIVEALIGNEVEQVSCGSAHVMVVTADRELFSWGRGDNGRLGLGNQKSYALPQAVALEPGLIAKAVTCGVDCSFVLTLNDRLLACGSNRCNKLALDHGSEQTVDESQTLTPITAALVIAEPVKCVTMGISHTAVLTTNGKCLTFGSNSFGQLGYEREGTSREPQIVEALKDKKLTFVSCGDTFTVAVSNDREIYSWGKGARGRLGQVSDENRFTPKHVPLPLKLKVISISCSHSVTMVCGKVL
ncbi:serine/threonine-protein kinase Nek8-like [Montipora capricornis]|uniref:serine/threonine-protein kinase Nek8-like n=1 Tax=Montipora capricornis TaxID=246305 RepID=UPI0035F1253E